MLVATTPLAVDMYLPAFNAIAAELGGTAEQAQLSLSTYLAGYAIGMIVFGPLVDQFGRRKLALAGLLGFGGFSLWLALTPTISSFILLRALQAFCGAAITVTVPGIIRYFYKENTAKGMSYVSMIMLLAPLLAPAIGSILMIMWHWSAIFYALCIYALLLALLVLLYLPEVPLFKSSHKGIALFFRNYQTVFGNHAARIDILSSMLASFAFFCFLTSVSSLYMDFYHADEKTFSILFAVNVVALMCGNLLNSRLVSKIGSRNMLYLGLTVGAVAASSLVTLSLNDAPLLAIVTTIAPLMMSLGIIATNADALILIEFEKHTGTATAVIGTLRFGSGALAGPFLAVLGLPIHQGFATAMLLSVTIIALAQAFKVHNAKKPQ